MSEGRLRVNGSLSIRLDEIEWKFSGSGGPGGQHANTSNTRSEAWFDIANSPSLGPRQRERLLARFGPSLRVVASDERSQSRNRDLAVERLRARLADGLRVEKPRRATRPTLGSKERRLQEKREVSARKRDRSRPVED